MVSSSKTKCIGFTFLISLKQDMCFAKTGSNLNNK